MSGPEPRHAIGISEAASYIGVGLTKMKALVREGHVTHKRLDRRVLIRVEDLHKFVDQLHGSDTPALQ